MNSLADIPARVLRREMADRFAAGARMAVTLS